MDNSDLIVESCDENKIKCKECKWSTLLGFLNSSCVKFSRKPSDVYYNGANCSKFEPRGDNDER